MNSQFYCVSQCCVVKKDLRLSDNAAINDAVNRDLPIICLFNLDSQRIGRWTYLAFILSGSWIVFAV